MGHWSIVETERYIHAVSEDLENAIDSLEDSSTPPLPPTTPEGLDLDNVIPLFSGKDDARRASVTG
jgi:hypothetical protein